MNGRSVARVRGELLYEVRRKIKFDKDGHVDTSEIIGNYKILQRAGNWALFKFSGKRVTKVLAVADDNVPLATMVGNSLGVNLVLAKRNRDRAVKVFLEETIPPGRDSGEPVTLYVPKHLIKTRDDVLIVSSLIRSGANAELTLASLVHKAGARLTGVFSLMATGEKWKKKLGVPKEDVEVVLYLEKDASAKVSSKKETGTSTL